MVEQTNSQESNDSIDSTTEELEPTVAVSKSLPKETPQQETRSKIQSLEEWADSIVAEDGLDTDGIQATINLSRFGLKTPQDVVRFLKSPAGEATIAEIGAEIAKTKAIQEQQQFEQQQHELLMHRLRALLLLWYIAKDTHAAEKISELTKELNDKLLKAGDKSKSVKSSNQSDISEARSYFNNAIDVLTEKHQENTLLTKTLTERLEQLMEQEKSIETKYAEYDSGLREQEKTANNGNFNKDEVEQKIKALSEEIDKMTSEIGNLLEEGRDTEARALLNKQNALNLQIGVLHDVRAVNNNQKYYADAQGNLVATFKEAHFILAKGEAPQMNQRIIKDNNGQLYLLKPGQDWNTVKENPEAKAKARQDYKVLKQDLMSVKSIVRHHRNYEHRIQKEQINDTEGRLAKAKEEGLLISNQLTLVQAARASAEDAAKQLHLSPRPIPSPTPSGGSSHTQKPSQASATIFYREQIKALRESHHVTRGQLMQLASQAPAGGKAAVEYLRKEFEGYSRRGPIPQVLMQSYLRNLERFGVDTTKPGVTTIKTPIEEQKDAAPNPFKTKPSPFK